jgi:hypothetical protein
MSANIVRNKLSKNITSLSLDKEELKKLLALLQERANAACEFEYKKIEAVTDQGYNKELAKDNLKSCSILKVTITGNENKELFGSIDEVFNSISFPEKVKAVYVHSEIPYKSQFNYYPENFFELFIDFSKPRVFDFSFQPSEKTPNNSQFKVEGSDNTWVNGVFHEIDAYFEDKPSKFSKVHKGSIYDFLIWFFGMPFGFWSCYKFSTLINKAFSSHPFLENALFVYTFFISLFVIRILFHYFRWVYPMIEYRNKKERSIGHQAALFSIALGIIGKVLYDVIKLVF